MKFFLLGDLIVLTVLFTLFTFELHNYYHLTQPTCNKKLKFEADSLENVPTIKIYTQDYEGHIKTLRFLNVASAYI